MATRRLLVEILGDDASLQASLGRSAATSAAFGDRLMATGAKISSVGKTLTTHLTLPIMALGVVSGKAAVDFQNSMELLHTQAGVSQKAVESLSKSVLALAGPTATAPDELSAGLYHLASQGLRGKESLDALRVAAEGAKLGQANLEDVTNALGAVIVSHIGGVHSYGQAMGELNKIVGTGDMRMQDLADAMGTGLPANAKIAGVSLDAVGGALATFGDNNIRGARAGTLLNSTLRIMSAPSTAAAKALAAVGIGADELGNKLRTQGLVGALDDLKTKMEAAGLSATEQGILLTHAFGGRQATGVKLLIDELDRLKTKTKEVGAGGGQFASDWTAYTKTTAYHLASMGAQMQATGVTIGTLLLPVVARVADVVGSLAARFEALSPTVQKVILVVAGLAAAVGPVVGVIGSLTTALGFLAANPIVLVIAGVVALTAALAAAVIWPDKLKSVLEKMGLSAHAAGEIVRSLQDVFHVVATAGEALVGIVRANWSSISGTIHDAVDIVKAVIGAWVGTVEALWRTFGSTLTAVARTYWNYIKETIHNALTIIHGIFDVIDGLIHGNWSQLWNGVKEIAGGAISQVGNILHTAISLLGDAAKLIGTAVYKGIVQPLLKLGAEVLSDIESAIESAIHTVAGWVVGAAAAIGHAIVSGIVNGVGNLAGDLASKVKGAAGGALNAVKGFLGIGSPSRVFAQQVGLPIAQGILVGYLEGAWSLPAKLSASVRTALEAARKQVEVYQGKFRSAFSDLKSAIDRAMSGSVAAASTAAGKQLAALLAQYAPTNVSGPVSTSDTAAGKQLAALQAQQQQQQLQDALNQANAQQTAAQQQLASDQAGGADATTLASDQAAVTAAAKAVADAQTQIQMAALQAQAQAQADAANQQAAALKAQAATEAKHETAMKALRKHNADQALAALEARLGKEGATQKQAQEAIVKLLKKYGLTYHDVAADMGKKFAKGLEESIHLTAKAAEELAKEIAKYLPHSPAEKGPLSKPIGWQAFLLKGLDPGLKGKLGAAVGGIVGGAVPDLGVRGGGGAGGAATATFNLYLTAPAGGGASSPREYGDAVVTALSQWARRNGRSELRSLLGGA